MSTGQSMGRAFRPSRFGTDAEPERVVNPVEKQSRIRVYARRVRLRLPLFEAKPADQAGPGAIRALPVA